MKRDNVFSGACRSAVLAIVVAACGSETPNVDDASSSEFAATVFAVKVNFQPYSVAAPSGMVADVGSTYGDRGNGFTYGWRTDNRAQTRERNASNSPDKRYDTLTHLQKSANPDAIWELAVPSGNYDVRVVAGDPLNIDSVFKLDAEAVRVVDGTPTSSQRWLEGTRRISVTDGKLTLRSGSGASNNKVNFIEVTQVPSAPSGPTGSTGSTGTTGSTGSTGPTGTTGPTGPSPGTSTTLKVNGRFLYDTCGNKLIIRGVEQVFGFGLEVNGSFTGLVDEIAKSGSNAVRVLPNLEQLSVADVDTILGRVVQHGMVFYLSPGDSNRAWLDRSDVKAMIEKYKAYAVLDVFQEPRWDDRARSKNAAIAAIQATRAAGYTVPVLAIANQYGRDLPAILADGASIVAADTQRNTILGWQAYWGRSNWYQNSYKMTLSQAVTAVANAAFPIQIGLDNMTDPNDYMDYGSVMIDAQAKEVGWLWWDWYNPFSDGENELTTAGTYASLTSMGQGVVRTHAASIQATAKKACVPQR